MTTSDWTPEFEVLFGSEPDLWTAYKGTDPEEANRIYKDTVKDTVSGRLNWKVVLRQRPVGPWYNVDVTLPQSVTAEAMEEQEGK